MAGHRLLTLVLPRVTRAIPIFAWTGLECSGDVSDNGRKHGDGNCEVVQLTERLRVH